MPVPGCTKHPGITCQKVSQSHKKPRSLRIESTFSREVNTCIHAQQTGWQSGVLWCILPGLPTHLEQELNVGTVQDLLDRSNETNWTRKMVIAAFLYIFDTLEVHQHGISKKG